MKPIIGYAGLSHLGLVSSVVAAAKGFDVVAYDPDAQLVTDLNTGQLSIHEPHLAELLEQHQDKLQFTTDPESLRRCAVVYVSQDVPTDETGSSNLEAVERLLLDIAPNMSEDTTLVTL